MRIISFICLFSIGSLSCDVRIMKSLYYQIRKFEDNLLDPPYNPVLGKDATHHLEKTYRSITTDVNAVLEALSIAEQEKKTANLVAAGLVSSAEESEPVKVEKETIALLQSIQKAKLNHQSAGFAKIDDTLFNSDPFNDNQNDNKSNLVSGKEDYDFAHDTVNWTHAAANFTISTLEKMPVRNQGERSTCASFSGIGHIEGFLLKNYNLSTVDLSEQRFYYLSKPDSWENGGDIKDGGSNSGTGFGVSSGHNKFPPAETETAYNIPFEKDCPYNTNAGQNDLQTPQLSNCKKGVVSVVEYAAWVKDWNKRILTANDIYQMLVTEDLPVIVATKLSPNWEDNDGMITLKDAKKSGDSVHAAGHAYLIVGAKKINDADFPGEGGMCFIIRNSWGKGWGVNGLSCMTLAWFNAWRYESRFPRIFKISADPAFFGDAPTTAKEIEEVPSGLEEKKVDPNAQPPAPEVDPSNTSETTATKRRGRVSFNLVDAEEDEVDPKKMKLGALVGSDDAHYKLLYQIAGSTLALRGILAGNTLISKTLRLSINKTLIQINTPEKGLVTLGEINEKKQTLQLCSQNYSSICHFNYISETNEMVVGLTEPEAKRRDYEAHDGDWTSLDFGGYGIAYTLPPGLNTYIDIKFIIKGTETNPLRFLIKPVGGDIITGGRVIGNYQDFAFCNGPWKKICRVVISAQNFFVFFKAKERARE